MNSTAFKRLLTVLLLLNAIVPTTLNAQRSDYLSTFPGGVIFLPTINANNVIIRYHNILGGFKEVTFYPFSDTLTAQRLDTCKREYIALAWSYDALERRYIDSTYSAKVKQEQMIADNAKQARKVRRKSWFRGFLWGVPVGIVGGIMMFVRI